MLPKGKWLSDPFRCPKSTPTRQLGGWCRLALSLSPNAAFRGRREHLNDWPRPDGVGRIPLQSGILTNLRSPGFGDGFNISSDLRDNVSADWGGLMSLSGIGRGRPWGMSVPVQLSLAGWGVLLKSVSSIGLAAGAWGEEFIST